MKGFKQYEVTSTLKMTMRVYARSRKDAIEVAQELARCGKKGTPDSYKTTAKLLTKGE